MGVRNFSEHSKICGILLKSENGEGKLYIKGEFRNLELKIAADNNLANVARDFATDGYRPIVMATRVLAKNELDEFHKRYENACASLVNVEAKVAQIFDEYENNLEVVGIAALKQDIDPDARDTVRLA